MDLLNITVVGRLDGEVSIIEIDGQRHLIMMIVTRTWGEDGAPTEMKHPVIYRPISQRQADFFLDAPPGTGISAVGTLKPMMVGVDMPTSYMVKAIDASVSNEYREARALAKRQAQNSQEHHARAPEPPPRPVTQSQSGWRNTERDRSTSQRPAPSRPAPSQGGYNRDHAPARTASQSAPRPAPERSSYGQSSGYGNNSRSSQYRSSAPHSRQEPPGPVLDF